ncbi:MAG: hypothetical protein II551_01570 [Paludibacteraceae bacterium]|nr:hypothetical protein [Paludibacteraceae bacterium]
MKHVFYIIALAVVAVVFPSCLTGEDNSTPVIQLAGYMDRYNSLGVHDSIEFGDTVHVGDTLVAHMMLMGGYNNLTGLVVSCDTSVIGRKLVVTEGYEQHLASGSDPENGKMLFIKDVYLYPTDMRLVAKKTGDAKVLFTLSSTASEKYSPLNAWIMVPIR